MECVRCASENLRVIRTVKKYAEYDKNAKLRCRGFIIRHRLCIDCGLWFATKETIEFVSKYDQKGLRNKFITIKDYKKDDNQE